ncbi:MAG TPA: helix-turn-helix domain-containing protein [Candidatus Acidoferrales bacterium]|nr:helix-turn-helix domain-containing protein [Candidatus Acidoferrales bacterium]
MAELTQRHQRAIAALLSEATITAAAKQCGCGERTLRRWLSEADFRRAYREASRRVLDDAVARLRALTGEAVETLRTAFAAQSDSVRVRAATAILDAAIKVETDDLGARVAALEAAAKRRGDSKP